MKTGHVDDTIASILRDLRMNLSKLVDLGESVSYGLLVALAFTDENPTESGLDGMNSQITVNDYLIKAKKVLAERPELAQLGSLIDEKGKRRTYQVVAPDRPEIGLQVNFVLARKEDHD